MSTPQTLKSETLRVTIVKPCSSAVAAIKPSAVVMTLPFLLASIVKRPHLSAIFLVTGNKFDSNQAGRPS